jgi:hypothetical protein
LQAQAFFGHIEHDSAVTGVQVDVGELVELHAWLLATVRCPNGPINFHKVQTYESFLCKSTGLPQGCQNEAVYHAQWAFYFSIFALLAISSGFFLSDFNRCMLLAREGSPNTSQGCSIDRSSLYRCAG